MNGLGFRQFLSSLATPKKPEGKVGKVALTAKEFKHIAVVSDPIYPHMRGRVRYQSAYWYAMTEQYVNILPKTRVLVVGRECLTLLVKPLPTLEKPIAAIPDSSNLPNLTASNNKIAA